MRELNANGRARMTKIGSEECQKYELLNTIIHCSRLSLRLRVFDGERRRAGYLRNHNVYNL